MNLDRIKQQIKWIIEQIQCLKKHDCECERSFNLKTSTTDSPQGDNGAMVVSENVKQISAYDAHLEFVDSPEINSGISGHTVLKLKDEIAEQLSLQNLLNAQELNLGWKNGDTRLNKNPESNTVGRTDNVYSRNGFISYELPSIGTGGQLIYTTPTLEINNISNLIVDIPNFDKIKKYNPKLVITRFRNSKTKGPQEIGLIDSNHYSTAKFRISKHNFPFRPSEIALNSGYQVLDIGQENYFNVLSYDDKRGPTSIDMINTRGCGSRYSTKYEEAGLFNYKAWVYLEFRLQFTVGNVTYLSKPLNKLKLFLNLRVNYSENQLLDSKIKFKFA